MKTIPVARRDFLFGAGALSAAALTLSPARMLLAKDRTAMAAGRVAFAPDLNVNRMGFGAMRITGDDVWGDPADPAAMKRLLRRAVDLGVNFIDTADAYGPEVSERLIAEALHPYPAGLVIGTKGGIVRPSAPEWNANGRPEHLRAACEGSLKRLRLDRIDLYMLHAVDPQVPLAESMGALAALQREGKIRHVGVSNFSVAELEQARSIVKVAAVQNAYNVAYRRSEDVLQVCEREGIVFIPHTPLARAAAGAKPNPRLAALAAVAAERSITMAQAALAWLLSRSAATLPIPGTSRLEHLEENVAAAQLRLSAQEMAKLA